MGAVRTIARAGQSAARPAAQARHRPGGVPPAGRGLGRGRAPVCCLAARGRAVACADRRPAWQRPAGPGRGGRRRGAGAGCADGRAEHARVGAAVGLRAPGRARRRSIRGGERGPRPGGTPATPAASQAARRPRIEQLIALAGTAALWSPVPRAGMGATSGPVEGAETIDGLAGAVARREPARSGWRSTVRDRLACAGCARPRGAGRRAGTVAPLCPGAGIPQPGGEESLNVAAAAAVPVRVVASAPPLTSAWASRARCRARPRQYVRRSGRRSRR